MSEVQTLRMTEFETNRPPKDGQVCLVEFYAWSELLGDRDEMWKRRFQTLTWKSDKIPFPHPGRFYNANDNVVMAINCRWLPLEEVRVVDEKEGE